MSTSKIQNWDLAREIVASAELYSEQVGADHVPSTVGEVVETLLDLLSEQQRRAFAQQLLLGESVNLTVLSRTSGVLADMCRSLVTPESPVLPIQAAA